MHFVYATPCINIPQEINPGIYDLTITASNSIGHERIILPIIVENGTVGNREKEEQSPEEGSIFTWLHLLFILIILLGSVYILFNVVTGKRGIKRKDIEIEYVPDLKKKSHPFTSKDWGDLKPRVPLKIGKKKHRRKISIRIVHKPRKIRKEP